LSGFGGRLGAVRGGG
jgi:hypothetical protein